MDKDAQLKSKIELLEKAQNSIDQLSSEMKNTKFELDNTKMTLKLVSEQQQDLSEEYDQKRTELQQAVQHVTSLISEKENLEVICLLQIFVAI